MTDRLPADQVDDGPTVVEVPAVRANSSGAIAAARADTRATVREILTGSRDPGSQSHSTSVVTPRETLQLQEIAQTRAFVRIAFGLAVIVSIALTMIEGDPTAKTIFYATLALVAVTSAWLGFVIRDDSGYSIARALVCGYACIVAANAGIYYFGVFSPAPVIIPFGLCFFSTGQSQRGTLSVYASCAGAYLLLAIVIMAGLLPDRGLIRAAGAGLVEQVAIVSLVEATFFATYLISRVGRSATLYAIEQHDRALQGIAHREALLAEARQELAQQLGDGAGRYTERTLGAFKLGKVIGRGAMGEVYEAVHVATKEEAAVKVLLDHVLAQPDHVQRFFREARIASSLNAPNVVRVLGAADVDAAIPYLAMERLHGVDLSTHLREHRRLSMSKVVDLVRQVGRGLEAARAANIVHRDLKPRNLFLARGDIWKILDFGVSKLTYEEGTLTRDRIVGTPTYMAPEQINAGAVDHRTDLFALGVIAYRALTGRPAFDGDAEPQILYKVVHGMPPRPSDVVSVPKEVDLVMAIAIAKHPNDRFDAAVELAQALDDASDGRLDPALVARANKILSKTPWEG